MKRFIGMLFISLVLVGGVAVIPAHAAPKKVKLVYVEWPCAVVTNYIAKVAIEERLGHEVELMPVSVAVMWQSLASKMADATVAAWLPVTHATYMETLKGKVEDLGVIVSGAKLGWVVPDYVPLKSIPEMKGQADKFKGRIYGIDPGAIYMEQSVKAIKGYGLDGFELVEGSDAAMIAMLKDGIRKNEWVAITGWAPHWMFGAFKLHFLEDPDNYFGQEEGIHAVGRMDLEKDMPDVHAFLKKFSYTDTLQLQAEMAKNEEKGADPLANARAFVKENKEQVDSWFK